jgi:hypothetical protein
MGGLIEDPPQFARQRFGSGTRLCRHVHQGPLAGTAPGRALPGRDPNDEFDGLKPLEVIERGEMDRLWDMIFYLESGIAS